MTEAEENRLADFLVDKGQDLTGYGIQPMKLPSLARSRW